MQSKHTEEKWTQNIIYLLCRVFESGFEMTERAFLKSPSAAAVCVCVQESKKSSWHRERLQGIMRKCNNGDIYVWEGGHGCVRRDGFHILSAPGLHASDVILKMRAPLRKLGLAEMQRSSLIPCWNHGAFFFSDTHGGKIRIPPPLLQTHKRLWFYSEKMLDRHMHVYAQLCLSWTMKS